MEPQNAVRLIDRFREHSRLRAESAAFRFPSDEKPRNRMWTWKAAYDCAWQTALCLRDLGVREEERVAIFSPSPREQIFAFLATTLSGAVPTILSFPSPKQSRERFLYSTVPMLK